MRINAPKKHHIDITGAQISHCIGRAHRSHRTQSKVGRIDTAGL